ncbi:alcohol dehydrogenase catalytic domain-containing protein [Streptomyces puniciscabiei]|uniref:alcohol dehydrogenase catalytic domain-containing protein n=1 Tax=Streptomyces puniciscabiei TaxID=164348 RepID=UPI0037A8FDA9
MKAIRYYAPGQVEFEDVPEPAPGPGEIKLRVRNCCLCGADLRIAQHGSHRMSAPRVMGHEIAGEITELGDGVAGWSVGDRVQVIGAIPCGSCAECDRGWPRMCLNLEAMGHDYDGGFAEYVVVPAKVLAVGGVNRIPDGVGFAEASFAEPLSCVINGQELVGVGPADHVVVVGAGPIGCLHVRLARAAGAAKVILVELNRERLDRAAELVQPDAVVCAADGRVAEEVLALTGGRGADVVITATPAGAALEEAVMYCAPRGRISIFGGLPKGNSITALDANVIHYRELVVVGASASSPEQNTRALEMIADGVVEVADLISHRLPLERFFDALDLVDRGDAVKVTFEPATPTTPGDETVNTQWVKVVLDGLLTEPEIQQITDNYETYQDRPLLHLGLDSMKTMGVILNMESKLGLKIDYEELDLAEISTLGRVRSFIDRQVGSDAYTA